MKTLLLIRHAKSSWDFDVDDFDRPLNTRGKADAPAMAKRLLEKGIKVDCFVSSPAKRAITTALFFAEAYDKELKNVLTIQSLYEPSLHAFFNAVESLNDNCETVALFSHNPSITDLANKLSAIKIDNLPTCGIFAVQADVKKRKEFSSSTHEFLFFDYPKAG